MNKILHGVLTACAVLLLASCASKKTMVNECLPGKEPHASAVKPIITEDMQELAFVRRVFERQVYARNIVGNMTLSLTRGGRRISAPGSVHMRKDKVIRLQVFIPFLGTEVGRIEFTPDGVLIIDRMHKEYVRADYRELDFLRDNGLTFYSLQALFWNQLLIPGKEKVSESDLKSFDARLSPVGETVPLVLKKGSIEYRWNAQKDNGRILSAVVSYQSNQHGKSTLTWSYDHFKAVGVKQFPAKQVFSFMTTATKIPQQGQVIIDMNDVQTDDGWEERSAVSSRYKKMDVKAVLDKLLNM